MLAGANSRLTGSHAGLHRHSACHGPAASRVNGVWGYAARLAAKSVCKQGTQGGMHGEP